MVKVNAKIIFYFLFFSSFFLAAAPLDNIPTNSWIYDAIDYLKTIGYITSIPASSKPWTRQEIISLLKEANISKSYNNNQAGFYINRLLSEFADELMLDLKTAKRTPMLKIDYGYGNIFFNLYGQIFHSKFPNYWLTPYGENLFPNNQTLTSGFLINLDNNSKFSLFHRSELTFYNKKIYDTTDAGFFHIPGLRVMESSNILTYDIKEAYLSLPIYFLTLEFGRDYLYFGPAYRSSVILSDIAPSFDQIQLRVSSNNYKALWFVSALSPWNYYHRFLSGQRFEVNLGKYLRFGGTMLVVYSFDSLQTKGFWGYLNPLLPIYEEVANTGHDDNFLIGFDLVAYLKQLKIYGQLMLDNYEFNQRPERPPNCYGLTFGVYLPIKQFAIRTEYSKITRYTYYHRIYHIAYTNYSVPLGHSLGPDADEFFIRFEYYPIEKLQVNLVGCWQRRGDGNRGDLANKTWEQNDMRPETFPSGIVEKIRFIGPEFHFYPRFDIQFSAGLYFNNNEIDNFIKIAYRI
ncbi:MAG: capsule assembly Wzi family protein [candidate division WOR-3 bacterium]